MLTIRLTPEQADASRAVFQRVVDLWRQLREQFAEVGRLAVAICKRVSEMARQAAQVTQGTSSTGRAHRDRPAWASPYGPPPRRRPA